LAGNCLLKYLFSCNFYVGKERYEKSFFFEWACTWCFYMLLLIIIGGSAIYSPTF